ncbi:MAG: 2,3-bisphosphoglycerate-independent phosphoglycerate mutase [Puniceicoccales bacterium]|jgi:2,3-bisphosphoglycerate-independent phosphoglycerate mutase|nr:2,3-bisphosphoglycerate-independent phosphoglycerate mutase [Puniceicoccales bacterium]
MHSAVLVICDGWGINKNPQLASWDAIQRAKTPFFDRVLATCPHTEIKACGRDVGLPYGVMGNSEVGHQNIGAGRIVDQEIVRIDKAFEEKTAENNPVILKAIEQVKKNNKKLHLLGLCSDGGVHSVLRHLYSLLEICKKNDLHAVYIHFLGDGRDTPPQSGLEYLRAIEEKCAAMGTGKIATVMGRFWAMDRDHHWERIEKAYHCLVGIEGNPKSQSAVAVIKDHYDHPADAMGQGDEFLPPTQIIDENGNFLGAIEDGDALIFFNFRGDRPREITKAFIDKHFNGFPRKKIVDLFWATLTEYERGLCDNVIFQRQEKMKNILGSYLSDLGISQFRCAETEKYAHVTFFFNDYREDPFPGEERLLIPSPRDIETYDQRPEMSAYTVKDGVVEAILAQKYGLIVVNFANMDMVGHTGNLTAAIKATETVDRCLDEIAAAVDKVDTTAFITADHGNIEQMWDPEHQSPHTQHTTNPVHLILYGKKYGVTSLKSGGKLGDLAPTLLDLMDLKHPQEMTGISLLNRQ